MIVCNFKCLCGEQFAITFELCSSPKLATLINVAWRAKAYCLTHSIFVIWISRVPKFFDNLPWLIPKITRLVLASNKEGILSIYVTARISVVQQSHWNTMDQKLSITTNDIHNLTVSRVRHACIIMTRWKSLYKMTETPVGQAVFVL